MLYLLIFILSHSSLSAQEAFPAHFSQILSPKEDLEVLEQGKTDQRRSYSLSGTLKKIESILVSDAKEPILHGLYEEYYPDGTIKTRGEMYFGKPQGKWTSIAEDGTTISGLYLQGMKTGEWTTTGKNGRITAKEQYSANILNGPASRFYPSGNLAFTKFYSNGSIHGISTHYYENGSKKSEKSWHKGVSHGIHRKWFASGVIQEKGVFTMGMPAGIWIWNDLQGKVIKTIQWEEGTGAFYKTIAVPADESSVSKVVIIEERPYVNGLMEGINRKYYQDGSKRSETAYKKGKKEGLFQEWRFNGTLAIEGSYTNDHYIGTIKEYYDPHHTLAEKPMLAVLTTYETPGIISEKIEYDEKGAVTVIYKLNDGIGNVRRFHSGRALLEEGSLRNGRKEGEWREFFLDGSLKSSTIYFQNQPHGPYTLWHPPRNGHQAIKTKGTFVGEKKEGIWMEWDDEGRIVSRSEFQLGIQDGLYTEYWPLQSSPVKKTEGAYALGEKNGRWLSWHQNGQLLSQAIYENGLLEGAFEEYHIEAKDRPALKIKGAYHLNKQEGLWQSFYADGPLHLSEYFEEGKLTGTATELFPNGQVKSTVQYSNGNKHGKALYYDDAGRTISSVNYFHGHPDGPFELHSYPDAVLSVRGQYLKGIPEGKWQWFAPDGITLAALSEFKNGSGTLYTISAKGKVQQSVDYVNGLENGYMRIWNDHEKLVQESSYNRGALHGRSRHFDSEGRLAAETDWSYGRKTGTYTSWHSNGKAHITANFNNDLLNGECYECSETGICRWRGHWQMGKREGTWTWYDEQGKTLFELLFDDGILLSGDQKSA